MTKKQKKQMIIIGILLLVFVYVLADSIIKVKKKKAADAAPKEQTEKTPESTGSETKENGKKDAADKPAPFSTQRAKTEIKEEDRAMQKQIAEDKWGMDPFFHEMSAPVEDDIGRPSVVQSKPDIAEDIASRLKLTGISKIGDSFIAVINRKMLKVGDNITTEAENLSIRDIHNDRVILEWNGGEYELKLNK